MNADLLKAIEIVDYLHDRVNGELDGENLPFPTLVYSKYTLAIMMDDRVLWEDQNSSHDDLTAEFCWDEFIHNCRILAKYVPKD